MADVSVSSQSSHTHTHAHMHAYTKLHARCKPSAEWGLYSTERTGIMIMGQAMEWNCDTFLN